MKKIDIFNHIWPENFYKKLQVKSRAEDKPMPLQQNLRSSALAAAAVIGFGTTKGGTNVAVGAAIPKVVSENTDFQMRPQEMGGSQQYIPVIYTGELEFGLSNSM